MREEYAAELLEIIRQVRRRWRMKLAMRGVLTVVGIAALVFLASASALEAARFTAQAILTARITLAVATAVLVALFLVRPLLRRVTDEQVALYLEENEPSLQESIVSAVEAAKAGGSNAAHSDALVRRLIHNAVQRSQAVQYAGIEGRPIRRYSATLASISLAVIALFAFGPAYLRHAVSALFSFSRDVEAAVPYRIDVKPGNATISRGADLVISASLSGFETDDAALMVRKAPDAAFERVPMVRAQNGAYDGMLFDLADPVEYYVEAEGVRSGTYTLNVVALPYVQRLELEYHFPAYTGLPPQKVEDGGDIAVLRGTEVRVRAVPTMPSPGGQVVLEPQRTNTGGHSLAPAGDGALVGRFTADADGFYHVELTASTGNLVKASPQYTIDVLADGAPAVSIARPGRDTQASPIEEVFVEARADDDFGIRNLELVFSVNGGEEKSVRLFDGQKRMPEVSAGHTFYLEELGLTAGDFVSYYARATDNDAVQGAKSATSDIYFMRIRPLTKDFKQAQSQASGGGGGGGSQDENAGDLSEQQKRIIAATFNIQRDRKTASAEKIRENSTVVALSQAKLREQVEQLVLQMTQRLSADESFTKILELLPKAIGEMKTAEGKLQAAAPDAALPPEQKALQYLQQAEEEYEVQVQARQQQGGGGGGGGQQNRDLSELFELEVDKMANQYEMRQQASQQQADRKIDELAEKLKELARRQEQEAERQRRRAAAGQQASGGGSGSSQRELAEQVEEAARRLEQLSREENRADLARSAQQLQQAADAMRRAAANGAQAGGAERAEALERLRQAEHQLQRSQTGRAERDVNDARRRAEEIANEQKAIAGEVQKLGDPATRNREQVQQLLDRKGSLEQKVTELERQIDRAAAEMRREERDASRRMSEAASSLRDNRVRDKIRYSGALVRSGMSQNDTDAFEREISSNLQALQDKLGEAQKALGRTPPDPQAEALEWARQLARGIDSLGARARERGAPQGEGPAEQSAQGQRGQQGQAGQQGQQPSTGSGQRGQQGEGQAQGGRSGQGQSGQQAQQGQGEQGQRGQQGSPGAGQRGQAGQQPSRGEGQGSQGGQGGRNEGQQTQGGRGGEGDTSGAPQFGGGFGSRRPGAGMTPEDARQFRAEVRQFTATAQQMRPMVKGQKDDLKALDEVLKNLRALDNDKVFGDPTQFDRLQAQAADAIKRFEFNLRRRAELKGNEVLLSGDGDVPEEFRKLVEQYYKSLSKAPDKK